MTEDGEILHLLDPEKEAKTKDIIPKRYWGKEWKSFQELINDEVIGSRGGAKKEPPHIKMMRNMELADFDDASDAGNLRWYTKGVLMKNLIKDYLEGVIVENGAIYADTPVMYTVKNKKLTAQTARFPAKTYWVHSGNNRYLLRFANDFLLFNLFSQMQIKEESLPLGVYEWEQYAFRREQKGELAGLRRLRAFVMPDLHTMCKDLDQSIIEFKKEFKMVHRILKDIGVNVHIVFRTTEQFWKDNNKWIKKSVKSFGKPIILSTGMNDLRSISKSVTILKKAGVEYALLHCTSMYPTPYDKVRLGALLDLKENFPNAVLGLSDHSMGNYTCFAAISLGASILEKHFTSNRKWAGPDVPISITPVELKDLIKGSKAIHQALGGSKSILEEEKPTIDFAYACVVAIKDIMNGEHFTKDNIWVKRPGTGDIKAENYTKILGKKSIKFIKSDTQIKWNMIDYE